MMKSKEAKEFIDKTVDVYGNYGYWFPDRLNQLTLVSKGEKQ